jgi:hypothetical protein
MFAAKEDKKNDEYQGAYKGGFTKSMLIFNAPYVVRTLLLMRSKATQDGFKSQPFFHSL